MNNQKIKADAGKPRLTLVPQQILYDVAKSSEISTIIPNYWVIEKISVTERSKYD